MAMSRCALKLTAFALAVSAVAVPSKGFAQVDTRAAAEHLRSHDAAERRRAFEAIQAVDCDRLDRDVRRALFEALQREGKESAGCGSVVASAGDPSKIEPQIASTVAMLVFILSSG